MADRVAAVAVLDEPTRRLLYTHVVRQPVPVSRDEVAAALRIPRTTVAFHLDKLVALDLLAVTFERRTSRAGPGAGRPAKLYHRSGRQVAVSLPERRYDLAGHLLAASLEEAGGGAVLARRARAAGEAFGTAGRVAGADLRSLLDRHGFEPDGDELRNCPFQALAQAHGELVCGMTLGLIEGMLTGLGETGLIAALEPGEGRCCVRLRRSDV
jgi:predicted ArsR family transcriptional regulator